MIASVFKRMFTPDPVIEQAHQVYVRIVEQARRPVFFRDWEVEDTLDGRFDVIVLHLSLVINRLEAEPSSPEIQHYIRTLSEVFFSDMDRSLRELGASDTGVGKRIKAMAQAFYGRLKAYQEALVSTSLLSEVVARNIYREKRPPGEVLEAWSSYITRTQLSLKEQPVARLLKGDIAFPQ